MIDINRLVLYGCEGHVVYVDEKSRKKVLEVNKDIITVNACSCCILQSVFSSSSLTCDFSLFAQTVSELRGMSMFIPLR